MRVRCSDSPNKCSARASGDAGDDKERTDSCTVIGAASVQEGREEGQAKGRQHVKWMVVE